MDGSGDETSRNKDRKRGIECVVSEIENSSSDSSAKKKKNGYEYIKVNPKEEKEIDNGKDVFFLLVSKIPYQWSCEQITDFINDNCIDVYALEQLEGGDDETGQRIRLTFINFEHCKNARRQLKFKAINGRKLDVAYIIPDETDNGDEMYKPSSHRRFMSRPSSSATSLQSSVDIWADDPSGTYGLKPSYLETLRIKPPIDKWVHVTNFRCDKSELKEALELAGQVVICRVFCASTKYARVMYSHPLEAVQAVAILNGQRFYGQFLNVSMYKCVSKEPLLPKGLEKIGPGLGVNGSPLRDIAQQFKRYLNGKTNCINETLFNISSNDTDDNESFNDDIKLVDNNENAFNDNSLEEISGSSIRSNSHSHVLNNPGTTVHIKQTSAPLLQNGTSNIYQSNQPVQGHLENSFSPGVKPDYNIPVVNHVPTPVHPGHQNIMVTTRRPQARQITPVRQRAQQPYPNQRVPCHSVSNYDPHAGTSGWAGPSNNNMEGNGSVCSPQKTSSVVELSNLPLSTTFPILSEKMAQVGQVISLQLTRVGCAVVQFATPAHAERCYFTSTSPEGRQNRTF